ncbi:TetR family transcriptional regulator [Streptomyces lividans]|uniref:Transcriptional regulator, TetR family n=2 Tax=Streptomyces lividans TaxID=1916 RepID=A0A7U9HFH3_STRLI|nr:Transcriptional regulator, TetR family [Streptomyces lividans 1326]KKD14352.1 TetR family transcriptional regulator [Streptomyces sp. WM6391]BDE43910.1 TetR family transcriptional regulator [Streptomyces lividans]GHA66685.1 TetR family transcriptional regulator [Streptomyces anthocyanicus]
MMAGKKQFDVDTALDAAMVQFWRAGYADTSLDDLSRTTGLNRSSLYSSFGDKESLYLRCLDRYAARYGSRYDHALSRASEEPLRAVRAFFEVTLERIADPEVPDGCLIAQTAMAAPVLGPAIAARAVEALGLQRARLRTALDAARLAEDEADDFAVHMTAVNQSLAVMSRTGASRQQLRTVVDISMSALSRALPARS